jgi:hypothetical protein
LHKKSGFLYSCKVKKKCGFPDGKQGIFLAACFIEIA